MLKIGIAGMGRLGRFHAGKLQNNPSVCLEGCFDIISERNHAAAQDFKIRAFGSFEELLENVDAVDIVATTSAHFELAKAALLAGKPIFVEKPLCAELWQAQDLVSLAQARNLKIQVGHIERFNPIIQKAMDFIQKPLFIEASRVSPFQPRGTDVSVVLDLMIHDIDLILGFTHSPVTTVHASGVGILSSSLDIASARIEFANGALANVTSSRVALKQERQFRIFQRDAYLSLDLISKTGVLIKKNKDAHDLFQTDEGKPPSHAEAMKLFDVQKLDASEAEDALQMELDQWVESILQDKEPVVDGKAGLRALEAAVLITNAIKKQSKFEDKP